MTTPSPATNTATPPSSTPRSTPPPTPLGLRPTFGFGDRLGLATPGHLDSLREHGGEGDDQIAGLFAQQSIREMARTHRQPDDVMKAARDTLQSEGFSDAWGADADHLKTPEDVDRTAAAGFTFFTIDPSDHVDQHADDLRDDELNKRFEAIRGEVDWLGEYEGKTVKVPDGPDIHFDDTTLRRAAVKYGRAIRHTLELASYIDRVMKDAGRDYEIELSVDETPQPTTLAEHYLIADRLRQANGGEGVKLVSLAPRYVGDFEKGIDYKGDLNAFEQSLSDHAAIARHLGPYKLSLHSGSDKLSIYAIFGRVTRGLYHVKTAGTSYLEALRVVSRHEPKLFRRIIDFSRGKFEHDRATYHISATLDAVPTPSDVDDDVELERLYLNEDDGRQILHVTFGSVLSDAELGDAVRRVLEAHPNTHRKVLAHHFGKHLRALRGESVEMERGYPRLA